MPKADQIHYLIIHCSDSKWGSVETIRKWHTDPPPLGRGWMDIGYHYVITNQYLTYDSLKNNKSLSAYDGSVFRGRDLDHDGDVEEETGSHCIGYNNNSLGICLIGADGKYTSHQMAQLYALCLELVNKYNISVTNVLGHYETENGRSQGKTCPDIDMSKFRDSLSFLISISDATKKLHLTVDLK